MIKRHINLVLILMLFFSGCGEWMRHEKEVFSGTVEVTEHTLGPKVAGRIMSLHVDEGSPVKKGDVLVLMDRYEQTKKDYLRAQTLLKTGGVNQQSVEYAQLAMEDQMIVSPVSGVVLVKVHDAGEMVAAGSAVIVVGDNGRYWVRIYVPEGVINRVTMGQQAKLKFDGLDRSFDGQVSFIASKAEFTPRNVQTAEERITQTFAVKVDVKNPPEFLRPGVACDVTLDFEKGVER